MTRTEIKASCGWEMGRGRGGVVNSHDKKRDKSLLWLGDEGGGGWSRAMTRKEIKASCGWGMGGGGGGGVINSHDKNRDKSFLWGVGEEGGGGGDVQ